MQQQNIVVIGGGTGTSVVLSGLKEVPQYNLSAIVVVSDNGGSTRRLRDEFGFLPVGDLRQCLAALASGENQAEVRDLLLYRFKKGGGLEGHNLGNLILTALEDMAKSPGQAIEIATKIFQVEGKVLPVTEENVQLVIDYEDGSTKTGEDVLDDHAQGGKKIAKIRLTPPAKLYDKAREAMLAADHIILGPGDLYGSLLPNTLAEGFISTLQQTKAKFIYIVNLMTHYSQTHHMSALDHVTAVSDYCGRKPDVVIINNAPIPSSIATAYQAQHEYPVVDDISNRVQNFTVITDDFASKVVADTVAGDAVVRSLLRHDTEKLTATLRQIIGWFPHLWKLLVTQRYALLSVVLSQYLGGARFNGH